MAIFSSYFGGTRSQKKILNFALDYLYNLIMTIGRLLVPREYVLFYLDRLSLGFHHLISSWSALTIYSQSIDVITLEQRSPCTKLTSPSCRITAHVTIPGDLLSFTINHWNNKNNLYLLRHGNFNWKMSLVQGIEPRSATPKHDFRASTVE